MDKPQEYQPSPPVLYCCHAAHVWQPLSLRQIRDALDRIIYTLTQQGVVYPGPVEIHLVDDATISRVNTENLGCTGPTNVLSFPGTGDLPGSLLLSLDTLERECLLYGQNVDEHILRLLSHGMIHLAGFDHGAEMDRLSELCLNAALSALID